MLALGVVLAGCVDGDEAGPAATRPASPEFGEGTGAIEGHVLTAEELPIKAARVSLVEQPDTTAVSDEAGRYVLSNLEPGDYRVQVFALGFQVGLRTVTVPEGEVTRGVDFHLERLADPGPYHTTHLVRATLSGVMWKLTPDCIYTDVNPLVKTCGGVRLGCEPDEACEVHYAGVDDFTEEWQTIIGEVTWTPQSGATGRGFHYDINAPNITRGSGGSINQADPYTWPESSGEPPITIRIDRSSLAERGIAPEDECCDWFWRLFPAACDLNICEDGFGPDYGVMLDNTADVYFTYFVREPAPQDWSALPEG